MEIVMNEITDYKSANGIFEKSRGKYWKTLIKVYDALDELVYDEITEFIFSTNGYDQEEISILWNLSDNVMRRLHLHGYYNPKYQHFSYDDETLVIRDEKIKVVIYPLS